LFNHNGGEFAVVVKPDVDMGLAAGVRFVREMERLRKEVQTCTKHFGGALIQQYIPGGADAMKTVVLVFSPGSRLTAAFTTQKIRQWPATGGITVVSHSTAEHKIVDQVLPFFEAWRWRGVAEVELKFDRRDGMHKVIEINPRFPGYLRFLCHCGLDVPVMAVSLALQRESVPSVQFPAYTVGTKYMNPGLFVRTVLDEIRSSGFKIAKLRKAVRDMRGSASLVLGMLADPLPMIGRVLFDLRDENRPRPFRITI
jgi:predicted ATP-grasp superfamily ATP-dependent carboligase